MKAADSSGVSNYLPDYTVLYIYVLNLHDGDH
jgi:hypothetical protein